MADDQGVSLSIPAKPDYVVLARLALSAVCRLSAFDTEEVADLKLAITEAATSLVPEDGSAEDQPLTFRFLLREDRLEIDLVGVGEGPGAGAASAEEEELGRAIVEATVDEVEFRDDGMRLVKYVGSNGG